MRLAGASTPRMGDVEKVLNWSPRRLYSKRTKPTTSAGQTRATRQGLRGFQVSSESQLQLLQQPQKQPILLRTAPATTPIVCERLLELQEPATEQRTEYLVREGLHRNSHQEEAASHKGNHAAATLHQSRIPAWAQAWGRHLPLLDVWLGVWFKGSQQRQ